MDATAILIVSTCFIWIIWDIYVWTKGKKTISQHIRSWSDVSMPIVFLSGFVAGHFFWPL